MNEWIRNGLSFTPKFHLWVGHLSKQRKKVKGGLADMGEAGVFEPKRVVAQAIKSAVETAIMILRIDDVISSKKA